MRRDHRHLFHRFEEPSAIPVNAGKPGRARKKAPPGQTGKVELLIKEWRRIVKTLSVSTRDGQAARLFDGTDSYWQSSGPQGKVRTTLGTWHSH